ncbi:MAG TPA: FAD-binding oxidoreductase [Streptosporangiaceae bacterium]
MDQRPAAIAISGSAEDVRAAVSFARSRGLRTTAQATGHNAAPLGSLADTVLVRTGGMRQISIDPAARIARAGAGVLWRRVAEAAAPHGLTALAGSSPDVGVVGYTLGGGLSWLGRAYGLSANNVQAVELVTAEGDFVRADACSQPDLFWALRGGGGSFGIVTAVELRLFPITEVYAGLLWWPAIAAGQVLQSWRELTRSGLPDELTTTARLLNFPSVPDVPEQLRGQSFAVIDVVHLGAPAEADGLLAPLRALQPVTDTIGTMPAQALGSIHLDPDRPVPAMGDGLLLDRLPAQAVDQILDVAGPGTSSPLLTVELRHLGGELRRSRPNSGALAAIDADYLVLAGGLAATPEMGSAVAARTAEVKSAVSPWAARQMYLNLAETSRDPASFWSRQAYERLRRIKSAVDPANLIRANHPVTPASN